MNKEGLKKLFKTTGRRRCSRCGKMLKYKEFGVVEYDTDKFKFRSPCKKCENQKRLYNYKRLSYRFKKFGITEDDYNAMYIHQQGKCHICNTSKDVLCVDHCHKTGRVRGLLCQKCNSILGYCSDNIDTLNNAIKYLKELA